MLFFSFSIRYTDHPSGEPYPQCEAVSFHFCAAQSAQRLCGRRNRRAGMYTCLVRVVCCSVRISHHGALCALISKPIQLVSERVRFFTLCVIFFFLKFTYFFSCSSNTDHFYAHQHRSERRARTRNQHRRGARSLWQRQERGTVCIECICTCFFYFCMWCTLLKSLCIIN